MLYNHTTLVTATDVFNLRMGSDITVSLSLSGTNWTLLHCMHLFVHPSIKSNDACVVVFFGKVQCMRYYSRVTNVLRFCASIEMVDGPFEI